MLVDILMQSVTCIVTIVMSSTDRNNVVVSGASESMDAIYRPKLCTINASIPSFELNVTSLYVCYCKSV